MIRKLFLVPEIKEDDTAIIKKVKEKISLEMTKRTQPESISLLGSALNPFAKDLTFLSQKDRETAHKGVTKTRNGKRNGKRNGMKNGMKRKICNAIYAYLS